jgi:hypothetical protein
MRHYSLSLILFALAALACNLPGSPITPTPNLSPGLPTLTPLPSAATFTPSASGGSAEGGTPTPTGMACTPDVEFLKDVTIPDGTDVQPGSTFVKTWQVKNSGTCDWDESFRLVQTGGAALIADPNNIPLPSLKVGQDGEIAVSMAVVAGAPTGGPQQALFEFHDPGGQKFGQMYALVNIPDPADLADQFGFSPGATPPPNGAPGGDLAISGRVWSDFCIPPNAEGSSNPQQGICMPAPGDSYQADGIDQADEPGIQGVIVSLFGGLFCRPDDKPLDVQVTDEKGNYSFKGLTYGAYCVTVLMQDPQNINLLVPGDWTHPAGEAQTIVNLDFSGKVNPVNFGWDYQFK